MYTNFILLFLGLGATVNAGPAVQFVGDVFQPCFPPFVTLTDENWKVIANQLLKCIEENQHLSGEQRKTFLLALADNLADVATYEAKGAPVEELNKTKENAINEVHTPENHSKRIVLDVVQLKLRKMNQVIKNIIVRLQLVKFRSDRRAILTDTYMMFQSSVTCYSYKHSWLFLTGCILTIVLSLLVLIELWKWVRSSSRSRSQYGTTTNLQRALRRLDVLNQMDRSDTLEKVPSAFVCDASPFHPKFCSIKIGKEAEPLIQGAQ